MFDYNINLYWEDGRFYQVINNIVLELSPYVGLQLEAYASGRDWTRKELAKYEPSDLIKYLEREEKQANDRKR